MEVNSENFHLHFGLPSEFITEEWHILLGSLLYVMKYKVDWISIMWDERQNIKTLPVKIITAQKNSQI